MKTPPIVSPREWGAAREQLLVKEKELTHAREALAAERRRMPWLAIEKEYEFDGPTGKASLLDLFAGRRDLTPRGKERRWMTKHMTGDGEVERDLRRTKAAPQALRGAVTLLDAFEGRRMLIAYYLRDSKFISHEVCHRSLHLGRRHHKPDRGNCTLQNGIQRCSQTA